jgi:hypothetical protein
MSAIDGMTVSATREQSRGMVSMTWRCSRLRRSAIEKKVTSSGRGLGVSATNAVSWA